MFNTAFWRYWRSTQSANRNPTLLFYLRLDCGMAAACALFLLLPIKADPHHALDWFAEIK